MARRRGGAGKAFNLGMKVVQGAQREERNQIRKKKLLQDQYLRTLYDNLREVARANQEIAKILAEGGEDQLADALKDNNQALRDVATDLRKRFR